MIKNEIIKFEIDDREKKKIELFEEFYPDVEIEVKRMEIGDVVITKTNPLIEDEIITVGVESKWSKIDFAGSVMDNRIFQQIDNMIRNCDYWAIIIVDNIANIHNSPYYNFHTNQENGVYARFLSDFYPYHIVKDYDDYFEVFDPYIKKCGTGGHVIKPKPLKHKKASKDVRCLTALGINLKQSELLLSKYSIKEICNLDVETIQKLDGFGKKSAEKVKEFLY